MPQRSRAQRLNGLFPLSYTGVVPVSPVNFVMDDRPPTINDSKNFYIGDLWLDISTQPPTASDLWMLVSLVQNNATWVNFASGISALQSLTGNSGGPVFVDGADNINTIGDGIGITIVGNPGTNTLTASLIGGGIAAQSFPTDSGTATPNGSGVLNINANNAAKGSGSSVLFSAPGPSNTVLLNVSDLHFNTLIGELAGNLSVSGSFNSSLGQSSLSSITSGNRNCVFGALSGIAITSGSDNCILGETSSSVLTTGSNNVFLGGGNAVFLVTGSNNIVAGKASASTYTTSESSNIILSNTGVIGDNNTIRIGTQGAGAGQQNRAFIAGVAGVTVSNQLDVVIDSTTGQLGTIAGGLGTITGLLAQDGHTVTPTAGVIQVSGANGLTTTGTVGPNTLTVTYTSISKFGAYLSATATDVTGDGTFYTVIFDTEIYDDANNYNNATGVFTAPVAGIYNLSSKLSLQDISDQTLCQFQILTTGTYANAFATWGVSPVNVKRSDNVMTCDISLSIRMDAGDTAKMEIGLGGGSNSKTVDVIGLNGASYFSGFLVH